MCITNSNRSSLTVIFMTTKRAQILATTVLIIACTGLFYSVRNTVKPACDAALSAGKIPSDRWVGALDTPATPAEIQKYCNDTLFWTPAVVTGLALSLLIALGGVSYFGFGLLSTLRNKSK